MDFSLIVSGVLLLAFIVNMIFTHIGNASKENKSEYRNLYNKIESLQISIAEIKRDVVQIQRDVNKIEDRQLKIEKALEVIKLEVRSRSNEGRIASMMEIVAERHMFPQRRQDVSPEKVSDNNDDNQVQTM